VQPFADLLGVRPACSWASRIRPATPTPRTRASTSATGSSAMRSAIYLYDELSRVPTVKNR
jgi:hypothetical protein